MFDYISFPVFLISLALGLFMIYIVGPEIKTVHVYPTPANVDRMLFKDKTDECFRYKAKRVDCPADDSLIQVPGIQA